MGFCRHKSANYQYERHRPEESLLYQVVSRNFQAFFEKCEEGGHPVPKFIKREFESFLRCGFLSYGFIAKRANMTALLGFRARNADYALRVFLDA